jgi:hypothetical protein
MTGATVGTTGATVGTGAHGVVVFGDVYVP